MKFLLTLLRDVPETLHGIYLMLRELNQPVILPPPAKLARGKQRAESP